MNLRNMILVPFSTLAFSLAYCAAQVYATPLANTFPPYQPAGDGDGTYLGFSTYERPSYGNRRQCAFSQELC